MRKQTTENQRFENLKFADEKKYVVDAWIEEIVSGTKKLKTENLAKNGMHEPLACVYVKIVAIP